MGNPRYPECVGAEYCVEHNVNYSRLGDSDWGWRVNDKGKCKGKCKGKYQGTVGTGKGKGNEW